MNEGGFEKDFSPVSGDEDRETREEIIHRVALVTVSPIDAGINALAGDLKDRGFEASRFKLNKTGNYTEEEMQVIEEAFSQYDAICFSTTDYGFHRAVAPLVERIKRTTNKPVIIGGVHAMIAPEECLAAGADAVCLGEGEGFLADLLQNWSKRNDRENRNFVVKPEDLQRVNQLREQPLENLDQFTPDLTYTDYWYLHEGKMQELTSDGLERIEQHQVDRPNTVIYASDRGCPHACTYCYNVNLKEGLQTAAKEQLVVAKPYLRKKSVGKIVDELALLKQENPRAEFLNLMNDDTAARPVEELQEFSDLYRERIGLPFYCMVSLRTMRGEVGREKLELLINAGLKELNIGVQTNEKTNKGIFGRNQSDADVIAVSQMVSDYSRTDLEKQEANKIDVFYDFIIHNPFESENDIQRTIDLVKAMGTPFDFVSHTLYIGRSTILRKMYEAQKQRLADAGERIDVVVEDTIGESTYHDTEKFYDALKDNENFVINSMLEFMAGRHDEQTMGRIPRVAADIFSTDVFVSFTHQFPQLERFVSGLSVVEGELAIDFLTRPEVINYFKQNPDEFGWLYKEMNRVHPIRYSNQVRL